MVCAEEVIILVFPSLFDDAVGVVAEPWVNQLMMSLPDPDGHRGTGLT